ncbi:MAG: hypothetical protein WCG04_05315 [Alphaproteobacteria bacterium]
MQPESQARYDDLPSRAKAWARTKKVGFVALHILRDAVFILLSPIPILNFLPAIVLDDKEPDERDRYLTGAAFFYIVGFLLFPAFLFLVLVLTPVVAYRAVSSSVKSGKEYFKKVEDQAVLEYDVMQEPERAREREREREREQERERERLMQAVIQVREKLKQKRLMQAQQAPESNSTVNNDEDTNPTAPGEGGQLSNVSPGISVLPDHLGDLNANNVVGSNLPDHLGDLNANNANNVVGHNDTSVAKVVGPTLNALSLNERLSVPAATSYTSGLVPVPGYVASSIRDANGNATGNANGLTRVES